MPLLSRIANLFRRNQLEGEIRDEIEAHLAMRSEDNAAAGLSVREADRDARVRFGNPVVIAELTAQVDFALWSEAMVRDVRFAVRQLRRAPVFSLTAILILSLGIGASTAIFSAVKPILIDPLPYPQARRLMMLWERAKDGEPMSVTFGTFSGLAARSRSFEALAVMKPWQPALTAGSGQPSEPERLQGQLVSAEFFRTLGVMPRLGRDFTTEDDIYNGPRAVILSDRLWRRRFAADPKIVGRQTRIDDALYTVVGVMPSSFEDVLDPEAKIWSPLQYDPSLPADGREWGHHLRMAGRLRSGATREQAAIEAGAILREQAQLYPKGYESSGGAPAGILVNPMQMDLTQAVRPALLAVISATALVLVMVCVNVTGLMLARSGQRRAEFAMRAALGASRGRLIRQLLTESLLLAGFGGILGAGIAFAGVHALVALSPQSLPRMNAIGVDGIVLAFAVVIVTSAGLLIGLMPAMQASRLDLNRGMRRVSRSAAGGRHRMRDVLVAGEVALAVVLLVSAGLLLRSMQRLLAVPTGFDTSQLITMQVQEYGQRYRDAATARRFFEEALEQVRRSPGVIAAGFTSQLPLSGESDVYGVEFEGEPDADAPALRYAVTPGYLEAMHIPLLRGRLIDARDKAGAPASVLINDSYARRVFAGRNPIGKRVRVGLDAGHADRPWATIVGVVGDIKQESLAVGEEDAFYISTAQWAWTDKAQSLVVRTAGEPAGMVSLLKNAIWSVDPNAPIARVSTMEKLLAATEAQRRFILLLFEAFALTGLVLAATGIYGVLAGSVTERTREIGVRAALGASRASLLSLVLVQGMILAAAGILVGFVGAIAASRSLAALLFGISTLDPLTYCAVAALLVAVAAAACLVPARRAATIDPMQALRME